MVSRWLKKASSKDAKKKLNLDKCLFRHCCNGNACEDDGSTIVCALFDKVNPTTRSGVNTLKNELNLFSLKECNDSVPQMIDSMKLKCNEIAK